jgi:hypothetical protein
METLGGRQGGNGGQLEGANDKLTRLRSLAGSMRQQAPAKCPHLLL